MTVTLLYLQLLAEREGAAFDTSPESFEVGTTVEGTSIYSSQPM